MRLLLTWIMLVACTSVSRATGPPALGAVETELAQTSQATRKPVLTPVVELPPVEQPCESDRAVDTSKAIVAMPSIITAMLAPGGKRYCRIESTLRSAPDRQRVIQRGTLRGIGYEISENSASPGGAYLAGGNVEGDLGSGGFVRGFGDHKTYPFHPGLWTIECNIDKVDDDLTHCTLSRQGLAVFRYRTGTISVHILGSHFPGSKVSIRVDDQPALSAPEDNGFQGLAGARMVAQLRTGKNVITRYEKWPSQSNVDAEFSLRGMPEALDILDRAAASLKRPR